LNHGLASPVLLRIMDRSQEGAFDRMKTTALFQSYAELNSEERSGFKSVARFMLPDSFTSLSCATLLCFLTSWGALLLARTPAQADVLWPANGIVLAFVLVVPRRYWASYLAGGVVASVAVHQVLGFPITQSWLFTVANVVEVLLAALWLAPQGRVRLELTNPHTLGKFLLYGVLLAPLASTVVVELILAALGRPARLLPLGNWFIGDAMGIAVMTPLTLAIRVEDLRWLFVEAKRAETLGILVGLSLLSTGVFSQGGLLLIFLLFPALLLVIFKLGSSGSAIGVFLMLVPAAYFTVGQRGPFVPGGVLSKSQVVHSIFSLQCFLGVALVTIYSVSTALAERDKLQQELTMAYRSAHAEAELDHVTGLANRRALDRQLALEWKRAAREKVSLSLLMIDVDRFKLYNDHYGHLAGDACLRAIATILAKAPLRANDLVARFGGEEFAIVLPLAAAEGAFQIGDRIRQNVADACMHHTGNMPGIVTISVGAATIRPTAEWGETALIEQADRALYQAKQNGRNQVVGVDGMKPLTN
jgi:diguanylate cyclase (GGDEF)-like protein